jgi:hypothetical protein
MSGKKLIQTSDFSIGYCTKAEGLAHSATTACGVGPATQICNVWGSIKTNRPSVNKYANLTRHSSSLLDLDNDSRVSIIGIAAVGVEVEDKPMCSE